MNPYLEALLSRPAKLPTMPDVVREIMDSFSKPDMPIGTLGRRISQDPVIAAKLLRLANSAFYQARRQVVSVDDCLAMLGLTTVRNVVLGCGLRTLFVPIAGVDLSALWQHSVDTACIARTLARSLGLDAELAFTVSLMENLGQLLMHQGLPERIAQINAVVPLQAPGRGAMERRALQFHHGDVSAALARGWNLPEPIIEALVHVPEPLREGVDDALAACVHLAAWCAWRSRQPAMTPAEGSDPALAYPLEVAQALGLDWIWWPASLDAMVPADAALDDGDPARLPELAELTQGLEELAA